METAKWQQTPCPEWCSAEHTDDDHPEDRSHRDDGFAVPITVRERAIVDDQLVERITELPLVIGRWQRDGEQRLWWHLGVDGGAMVEMSEASVLKLMRTLGHLQGESPEAPQAGPGQA